MYLRLFRRFVLMNAFEEGGSGGVVDAPVVDTAVPATVAPAPPEPPKTMLDAITAHFDEQKEVQQGQARDEKGRFAPTPAEQAAAAQAATAPKAVLPGQPAQPVVAKPDVADPLKVPEGLKPEAAQRFQALANNNRELTEKADSLTRQVSYVRETFEQHGVKQEQFEQAVGVIGMLNRGDLKGAKQALEQELRTISLALGESVNIDPLANYPDLRQAVDQMQVTPEHAMELARSRFQQTASQDLHARQTQAHEQSTQAQAAFSAGQKAVDEFCKSKQATDMDYAAIEAQLVPEIPKLLAGVPPQAWRQIVETQYRLMKQVAGTAKASSQPSVVLRPTGAASPSTAPKSAYEAMWGTPAPA